MTTFETMIARMGQKPNEFWLFMTSYDWACHVKLKNDDVLLEIKKTGDTAEEALSLAWKEFNRLTSALPEFAPAIEHRPSKPEFPSPTDDEIPF